MSNSSTPETDFDRARKSWETMKGNNHRSGRLDSEAIEARQRAAKEKLADQAFIAPEKKKSIMPEAWLKMQEEARAKEVAPIIPSTVKVQKASDMKPEEQKLVKVNRGRKPATNLSQEGSAILAKDRSAQLKTAKEAGSKVWRGILESESSGRREQFDAKTQGEVYAEAKRKGLNVLFCFQVEAESTPDWIFTLTFESGKVLTMKEPFGSFDGAERHAKRCLAEMQSDGAAVKCEIRNPKGDLKATHYRKEVVRGFHGSYSGEGCETTSTGKPKHLPIDPRPKSRKNPVLHVTKTNPNWIGKAKQDRCSFSRG